ncbi:MAG: hypothetical protein JEZ14_05280 [Marinilabiliaceae bacterium]|nr:hypothetical protein [Marinilabiliaceae bacterium]
MFVISKTTDAQVLIRFYIEELKLPVKSIHSYRLGEEYQLFWTNVRAVDNLTVYKNGFVIGKVAFNQPHSDHPYDYKDMEIPSDINPLLNFVVVKKNDRGWKIEPGEQGAIYYSGEAISDYTLLLALLHGVSPDRYGVGMLVATGYFIANATLFSAIKRVKYLHGITLPEMSEYRCADFEPVVNNDREMIRHLVSLLPVDIKASISLSGGMDSRFVLGLLTKKSIVPNAYTLPSEETGLVEDICKHLHLKLHVQRADGMHNFQYTLRTDARIYSSGGNYHKMIHEFMPDHYIFNGLCAEPALKNVYSSVWKDFRVKKTEVINQIIALVYLGDVCEEIKGVNIRKSELKQKYKELFSDLTIMAESLKKHEITRLFNHFNRSLNWVQAHTMDLSYTIYPLFLLANKRAVELGIRSPLYNNLYADRLRRMNVSLLPGCNVNYSGNRPFNGKSFLIRDIYKIYHEYFSRVFVYLKNRNEGRKGGRISERTRFELEEGKGFEQYFTHPLNELLSRPEVRKNTKRAALTVNNVLLLSEKYRVYRNDIIANQSH